MANLVSGTVKWYDPDKKYGFIVPDGGGKDILLHGNVLKNFGRSSVADGSLITVRADEAARGRQAVEVISITAVQDDTPPLFVEQKGQRVVPNATDLPLVPARVKWFDKSKGFGFANVFGLAGDVFVHIEVVQVAGLATLVAGEAIAVRIVPSDRGHTAVGVAAWYDALDASKTSIAAE